ncbi:MAG TPA: efflux RND transporter permease subunit [Candidatus Obscuribacterales bacterium]
MSQSPKQTGLSSLAIRQHIGTLVLTVATIILGFFVITQLPVDLLPSITYPRIGLRIDAPGLAPEVAVDEVTRPLEEALSATEGVVQVFSQTREGQISLDLFFEPGGDVDQALNDATATLNRARDRLPDTIGTPRLFKFDPSQLPVYELALTSPSFDDAELRIFADEELARDLVQVPGVASVDISGGLSEEVQVNVDLQRLQAVGVNVSDVLNALRDRNQDISGGRLRGGEEETLTRLVGQFQSAEEVRNLAIEVEDSDPPQQVYLRDVATVQDGTEEQRIFVLLNGQPAVKISIQKQSDANTVEVVDAVKARLESLRETGLIPENMLLTATLDESRFINNSIQNVAIAGLTGATLAAVAVLLFLGSLRQTFIIVLAIPLATLASIMMMGLFGLSLNVFSLGGLALGVGIVVDNAIVMLENISKDAKPAVAMVRNSRRSRRDAQRRVIAQAQESSQALESALLASTTTNLVSVLPFLLIGGFISLLFNELILTISFAVAASLLVALTVVPTLASRLLTVPTTSGVRNLGPIVAFGQRIEGLTQRYTQLLTWVLQHRIPVLTVAVVVLVGSSLMMVSRIPQEILPRINTGLAQVRVQFPPGTTLEANRRVMAIVDDLLLEQPETDYSFTTAGGFLFGSSTSENALRGSSTVSLKPGSDVLTFVERMEREFSQLSLIETSIRVSAGSVRGLVLNNSPVRSDLDVGLQGSDRQALEQAGRQVLGALNANASLARYRPDGEDPQPEIQIRPDWERAADLGLSTQDVGDVIQTSLNGSVPTQLQRGDRLVDIRVQLEPGTVQRPEQLRDIPLFARQRQQVRLGDIATIETAEAPGEIQRINQRQVFLIAGSLASEANLSDALAEVDSILADLDLPDGVTRLPSASAETAQELQDSLKLLGGLAAFMVFVVMAVQYNSLIDPLVIMLAVPLALAGGILGLFVTQTAIGATVIVGAVLLVGIVVNNAIILVELANQIRDRDRISHRAAILKAAPQRLRPILMTTITTVLGLFPLALGIGEGSEFLQPLGIVVFSGLSLSTLLTLFIIPCFYTLLHDPRWSRKTRGKLTPALGPEQSREPSTR